MLALWLAPNVLAVTYVAPEPLPEAVEAPITNEKTIDEVIHLSAVKHGVSESLMRQIIKCESGFRPDAVGDAGYSFGLVQIHLPSHPAVTKEQALDPEFATDFLAKNLSVDKGSMWTCYRMLQSSDY